jgi:hypothetical protein
MLTATACVPDETFESGVMREGCRQLRTWLVTTMKAAARLVAQASVERARPEAIPQLEHAMQHQTASFLLSVETARVQTQQRPRRVL